MASPRPTRLWLGRAGLAALALVLIIARLLPLDTLPPRWAGPDLLLAVLLLWTLRRPRLAPVWLIAGVVLVELSKQTRTPAGRGIKVQVPSPLEILEGVGLPRPGRAPTARREAAKDLSIR